MSNEMRYTPIWKYLPRNIDMKDEKYQIFKVSVTLQPNPHFSWKFEYPK